MESKQRRPWWHNGAVSDSENFHVVLESTPDDVLAVSLDGELDMADADWVEATLAAAAPHHHRMEVDLDGVSFIDSTGIRALVTLKQRADVMGLVFGFKLSSPAVRRALHAARLDDLVES